jgi:hypothetical protein
MTCYTEDRWASLGILMKVRPSLLKVSLHGVAIDESDVPEL